MLQPNGEHVNGRQNGEAHGMRDDQLVRLPAGGLDLKRHVEGIELALIRQALERSRGVVANAARLLGLRRTTLVEKMRKYRARNHRFDLDEAA